MILEKRKSIGIRWCRNRTRAENQSVDGVLYSRHKTIEPY